MSGRIPPYGKNFRLENRPYDPELANRAYVLKADDTWFIRSDKTSEHWQVFRKIPGAAQIPEGRTQPTLGAAMNLLLDGIDYGYYVTTGQED